MTDPMKPSATLLTKLGSIIVHFDEFTGDDGHQFDLQAAHDLLAEPEVLEWVGQMRGMALLPVKRNNRGT